VEVTTMRRVIAWLSVLALVATAAAQQSPQTYLSDIASNPSSTGGQARLLHYLPQDMPITVYVPPAPDGNGQAMRDAVIRAIKAWQQAAPDLVHFVVVGQATPDSIRVSWQPLSDKVATYRYAFSVDQQGQYRFHTTEVILDPRFQPDQLYRYALLVFGQAMGMLGRSPYALGLHLQARRRHPARALRRPQRHGAQAVRAAAERWGAARLSWRARSGRSRRRYAGR
jgi:hypothetical protein